jgi:glutamine amidotransferase
MNQKGSSARVAIIDYGVGNLFSVAQACAHAGMTAEVTSDPARIQASSGLILPGVGAFGFAMAQLARLRLDTAILAAVDQGKPLLGICLGFQLLFEESTEMGSARGLGLVPGRVTSLAESLRATGHTGVARSPHIGWLPITQPSHAGNRDLWQGTLLAGTAPGERLYFVHSFHATPTQPEASLAEANYLGLRYCCAVSRGRVFGCQFHPEKSAAAGLQIYQRFAAQLTIT